jgi:hypothetical protein
MLVILPFSKRGEIKISMILPYIPRDIIKLIISTIATNIAFFIISLIYLFFGFEKARDLYLSKLRFEKIAKTLRLKYKPPGTIYLTNINKLSYNFIWLYSRPSKLILDNLSNGLSYAFSVGKGGRGLFLQNIDLAHIITYTGGQLISSINLQFMK